VIPTVKHAKDDCIRKIMVESYCKGLIDDIAG